MTYAVQIVQDVKPIVEEPVVNSGLRTFMIWFFGLGTLFLFVVFILFLFAMMILKFQKKVSEYVRKKKDFLYFNFEENTQFCNNNRDYNMKRRKKRTLFLTWKRAPVYIQDSTGELRQIGEYNGETNEKENFYMVSIYNKIGIFKTIETIVLIPNEIKSRIVKKIEIDGKKALILYCEGIDEVGSTDYYMIPLIIDNKNPNKFVDFSDMVRTQFTDKIIYRNEIKEILQSSRENVINSVEANPNVHFNRRNK